MEGEAGRGKSYRLVLGGELDDRFAYLFEGMQIERVAGQTILTGPIRDKSQLHGFFERIDELGLELVLVERTHDMSEANGEASES